MATPHTAEVATADCTATLRVWKPDMSAAEVTARLGIQPTYTHEADERRGRQGQVRKQAMWSLSTDDLGHGHGAVAQHLGILLDRVEPARAQLVEMAEEGFNMDWFCFVGVNAMGGLELDPATLSRLGSLPIALDLDIYSSAYEA